MVFSPDIYEQPSTTAFDEGAHNAAQPVTD
jgi:hypothetical protein